MLEYQSRISLLSRTLTLQLAENTLHLLGPNQKVLRQIPLAQVRTIQQVEGMLTSDPDTGRYRSEICKLALKKGPPIRFRNGTYLRHNGKMADFSTNQVAEYDAFLLALKHAILDQNPKAQVVSGSLWASLAWWLNVFVGLGLLILSVAIFFTDPFLTAIGPAAFGIPMGSLLTYLGVMMGWRLWPAGTNLKDHLEQLTAQHAAQTVAQDTEHGSA